MTSDQILHLIELRVASLDERIELARDSSSDRGADPLMELSLKSENCALRELAVSIREFEFWEKR